MLLLGRYTGYRISELYRFGDLVRQTEPRSRIAATPAPAASLRTRESTAIRSPEEGGMIELVAALAPAAATGHPGDEPAQRRVHPRPQSARMLSRGGQQAAACATCACRSACRRRRFTRWSAVTRPCDSCRRCWQGHEDFVIKPNRGSGGRGILVVIGRDGETRLFGTMAQPWTWATSASRCRASSRGCTRWANGPTRR